MAGAILVQRCGPQLWKKPPSGVLLWVSRAHSCKQPRPSPVSRPRPQPRPQPRPHTPSANRVCLL